MSFNCVHLFWTHGLLPARLICPWDFPGKNTGAGCYFLLKGSSWPGDQTSISYIAGGFFTAEPPGKPTAEELGSEWLSNLHKVPKPSTVNQEFESRSFVLKAQDLSTFSLCPDQLCLQKGGEGRSFPFPFPLLCFPLSEPRCSARLTHSAVYLRLCSKG